MLATGAGVPVSEAAQFPSGTVPSGTVPSGTGAGGCGQQGAPVRASWPARRWPARARERGQSTVEFVLVLPFFALLLLAVVQIGLLVRTRVLVTHVAREAVREAAVGGSDAEVRAAAESAAGLSPHRLGVSISRSGDRVQVHVRYTDPTDVPVVGALVGDAVFDASASMRLE